MAVWFDFDFDVSLSSESVITVKHSKGEHHTTWQEVQKAIPDIGGIAPKCGGQSCTKVSLVEKPLQLCSKCRQTGYCSRECQVADWPTHKAQCKWNATISARQAAEKAAKLAKGEVYYDDNVLVAWFKRNSNVIEYAAFHALELWKGPVHSKFATHIACFDVEVDDQHADDDKRVRFHDAMLMSRDIVAMGGPTAERVKDALGKGYMPLMISDVDHQLKIMEFLPYPTHIHKDGPDKNWEIDTFLRLNGLAMGLC